MGCLDGEDFRSWNVLASHKIFESSLSVLVS
ncbi:hypothetical protein L195_g064093, partial [Trifolium pratense]